MKVAGLIVLNFEYRVFPFLFTRYEIKFYYQISLI